MEAISHAGTVLAVASKEGIAMAAEKVCHICPRMLQRT
jgi:20S proteasome alpha/beta subunit